MTSTYTPCPICGVANAHDDGRYRCCNVCKFNVLAVEWNRLSDAVRLARALPVVEQLLRGAAGSLYGGYAILAHSTPDQPRYMQLSIVLPHVLHSLLPTHVESEIDAEVLSYGEAPTLAELLIAVAEQSEKALKDA